MRLVISAESFALEDVPRGLDLSQLQSVPGVSWLARVRTLSAPLREAARVNGELARQGVCLADGEVRAAVAHALAQDPVAGPPRVAAFGDARAMAQLSRFLDAFEPCADCVVCDYLAVLGLADAIAILGGTVTDSQRRKVADYERRQRAAWRQGAVRGQSTNVKLGVAAAGRKPRLGRNDPCHCGSGRKYKVCHLELDASGAAVPPERH